MIACENEDCPREWVRCPYDTHSRARAFLSPAVTRREPDLWVLVIWNSFISNVSGWTRRRKGPGIATIASPSSTLIPRRCARSGNSPCLGLYCVYCTAFALDRVVSRSS